MQSSNLSTGSNTSQSVKQKIDIIYMIMFLTQKMNKKNPEKYPDCISVLSAIFGDDFSVIVPNESGLSTIIRSYALICDDLLWGTIDELTPPEGFNNAKDIKNVILDYFNNEWIPF